MRGLTPEQLLLLAAMALGLLLNLLIRWIRERGREAAGTPDPPRRDAPTPRPRPTAPPAAPVGPPAERRAPAPSAPPRRRRRGIRPLGRREARRAIALIAILGPCRANAPQGPDAIPAPPP